MALCSGPSACTATLPLETDRCVPGTDVDVNDRLGDVMIGYQKVFNRFTATGYVGYEIRDIDASPLRRYDTLHGTKSGFKVAFDV